MECISTRNPALDEGLEPREINQPSACPLNPPALARGTEIDRISQSRRVSSLYSAILNRQRTTANMTIDLPYVSIFPKSEFHFTFLPILRDRLPM